MPAKGCCWLVIGALTTTLLVLLALLVIKHKTDWCILAINAGSCEFNEEDEYCYCIDSFQHKNITGENNYNSSKTQCQVFNGILAAPDQTQLAIWLAKRMFFMGVENALVALRKLSRKWHWITADGQIEAVNVLWRREFAPNLAHEQGILTVETVKKHVVNDIYTYYNYDHYRDKDKTYGWYGFTTRNESFTPDTYYICKYDSKSGLISDKDTHAEENLQTSTLLSEEDPCHCTADARIELDGLDASRTFQSPRYPTNYCSDLNCKWLVTAPAKMAVQLDWLVFSLERNMDFVNIRDGHHPNSPIIKECTGWKCGNQRSSANEIQIHFMSDHVTTDLGFRARVTAVDTDLCYCSQSLKIEMENVRESFTINSPGYPQPYCAKHSCEWSFVAPPAYGFHITFKSFDLEYHSDNVYIYDGLPDTEHRLFDKCTGTSCPERITSSNKMHLTFQTDPITTKNSGFQGIITVVQNFCDITDIDDLAYVDQLSTTQPRDDGLIPVGGNATIVCTNQSKIQGTDNTRQGVLTCTSPQWSHMGSCVPTCKVEFYTFAQNNGPMIICKRDDPSQKAIAMIESGEAITMVPYDPFTQQPLSQTVVFSCNENDWLDQLNATHESISCHKFDQGPKILLIGGITTSGGDRRDEVELYFPTNPKRNRIVDQTYLGHESAVSGLIADGRVITCGGKEKRGDGKSQCEIYTPGMLNDIFLLKEVHSLNIVRVNAAAAVLDGVMHVCGGYLPDNKNQLGTEQSSCELLDLDAGWKYFSSMRHRRADLSMVAYDGGLVVVGGHMNTAEMYSPAEDKWSEFASLNQGQREYKMGAAAVLDGKLFYCGGAVEEFTALDNYMDEYLPLYAFMGPAYSLTTKRSCERYNAEHNRWSFVAPMNEGRSFFSMVTMGNEMFAVGGVADMLPFDDLLRTIDSVEVFNGKEWTTLETRLIHPKGEMTAVLIP